jgi:hypothetical protein
MNKSKLHALKTKAASLSIKIQDAERTCKYTSELRGKLNALVILISKEEEGK